LSFLSLQEEHQRWQPIARRPLRKYPGGKNSSSSRRDFHSRMVRRRSIAARVILSAPLIIIVARQIDTPRLSLGSCDIRERLFISADNIACDDGRGCEDEEYRSTNQIDVVHIELRPTFGQGASIQTAVLTVGVSQTSTCAKRDSQSSAALDWILSMALPWNRPRYSAGRW